MVKVLTNEQTKQQGEKIKATTTVKNEDATNAFSNEHDSYKSTYCGKEGRTTDVAGLVVEPDAAEMVTDAGKTIPVETLWLRYNQVTFEAS